MSDPFGYEAIGAGIADMGKNFASTFIASQRNNLSFMDILRSQAKDDAEIQTVIQKMKNESDRLQIEKDKNSREALAFPMEQEAQRSRQDFYNTRNAELQEKVKRDEAFSSYFGQGGSLDFNEMKDAGLIRNMDDFNDVTSSVKRVYEIKKMKEQQVQEQAVGDLAQTWKDASKVKGWKQTEAAVIDQFAPDLARMGVIPSAASTVAIKRTAQRALKEDLPLAQIGMEELRMQGLVPPEPVATAPQGPGFFSRLGSGIGNLWSQGSPLGVAVNAMAPSGSSSSRTVEPSPIDSMAPSTTTGRAPSTTPGPGMKQQINKRTGEMRWVPR